MFTIVSLAIGDVYEKCLAELELSLCKVGIENYRFFKAPSQGSWEKNCQYKTIVLREAIDMVSTPIVWVDADAIFTSYPYMFETLNCDIAFYYFPRTKEYLSGTVFLNNNDKVRNFLDLWIEENRTNDRWDQVNMRNVLNGINYLSIKHLPAEYCKIFDNKYQECSDPVIVHNQISRKTKRIMSGRSI